MTIADVKYLKLKEDWMVEMHERYLNADIGPAWIMEDENGPLCAFGAAFLWTGVCETWFHLIRKDKIFTVVRTGMKYLTEQGKKFGVRRYEATATCEDDTKCRFLEFMGFKLEGRKPRYNPDGSDAYMYGRLL